MESITDPDALAEIILFMDSCLSNLPPDMEEYHTLERYAEDLTEYHDGVFSLFPVPEPQEQEQQTKKERVDSQEEIEGQLSFLDQLEQNWSQRKEWKNKTSRNLMRDDDKMTIAIFLVPMVGKLVFYDRKVFFTADRETDGF